ncbi:hypothetical protein PS1_038055 [Malus domestica]
MNLFTRNRPITRPWPLRKHSYASSPLLYLTLLFLSYFFSLTPNSLFLKTSLSTSPKCPSIGGEKFLCGSLLSGMDGDASCLYAVNEDYRTTVWTYQNGNEDGALDSFQPDELLKKNKKISYIRKCRDVYNAFGPGSEAQSATLLAFGSLFTAPYKGSELHINIHEAPSDRRIQTLIDKGGFLPFKPEIISAGKKFAHDIIKAPFLCAQVRLLDGQFKNHWKATFSKLKQTFDGLTRSPLPIPIFMMTDLPESNWTGTYLGELVKRFASV